MISSEFEGGGTGGGAGGGDADTSTSDVCVSKLSPSAAWLGSVSSTELPKDSPCNDSNS